MPSWEALPCISRSPDILENARSLLRPLTPGMSPDEVDVANMAKASFDPYGQQPPHIRENSGSVQLSKIPLPELPGSTADDA